MCTGTFAFSTADGPIVSFTVADLATFVGWADNDGAVKEVVPDLGDGAYVGPSTAKDPQVIVFRKGGRSVRLVSTTKDDAGERLVTGEQLRELAELIESRM